MTTSSLLLKQLSYEIQKVPIMLNNNCVNLNQSKKHSREQNGSH